MSTARRASPIDANVPPAHHAFPARGIGAQEGGAIVQFHHCRVPPGLVEAAHIGRVAHHLHHRGVQRAQMRAGGDDARAGQRQRQAIGCGAAHGLDADHAAGGAAVLHHDGLAQLSRERVGQQPRREIDAAAGREGRDQADRARRLRARDAGRGEQGGNEPAAEGVLTVTNANLGAAIRLSLFEKGLDPRDFCLLSFGGAGGLHATGVAGEQGMTEVAFPREPGTLSAHGILFSDLTQDIARSRVMRAEAASLPRIGETLAALRAEADACLAQDGIAPERRRVSIAADMRYHGQAFELLVPWGEVSAPEAGDLAALVEAFHPMHRQRFSCANPGDPVEIVTLRAIATGLLDKPEPGDPPPAARPARKGTRRAFESGAWRDIPVWDREAMTATDTIEGPAIVEEAFATHWITRGWTARLGPAGTLMARRDMP